MLSTSIKNISGYPLHVRLNDDNYVRVSPGAVTAEISDVQLKDNSQISKLLDLRSIELIPATPNPGSAPAVPDSGVAPAAEQPAKETAETASMPSAEDVPAATSDTATKSTPKR